MSPVMTLGGDAPSILPPSRHRPDNVVADGTAPEGHPLGPWGESVLHYQVKAKSVTQGLDNKAIQVEQ